MPATMALAAGCVAVWVIAVAAGGSVWNVSVEGSFEHNLARNAELIGSGQWWRTLSYGLVNPGVFHLVVVVGLLLAAGGQVEQAYGTARFLAVLAAAWPAGAVVALLVEPAHAFNAGTSAAALGAGSAAAIDLIRRGVPWQRTLWIPTLIIIVVLGLIYPTTITWGAHAGGIVAGSIVGLIACDPRHPDTPRRTIGALAAAGTIIVISLLLAPIAARHTTAHGPAIIGAPAATSSNEPGVTSYIRTAVH